jgi:hypothetical protein
VLELLLLPFNIRRKRENSIYLTYREISQPLCLNTQNQIINTCERKRFSEWRQVEMGRMGGWAEERNQKLWTV